MIPFSRIVNKIPYESSDFSSAQPWVSADSAYDNRFSVRTWNSLMLANGSDVLTDGRAVSESADALMVLNCFEASWSSSDISWLACEVSWRPPKVSWSSRMYAYSLLTIRCHLGQLMIPICQLIVTPKDPNVSVDALVWCRSLTVNS